MNIAVLGWGSLVWCPGSLRIRTRWRPDGPILPIEFARISQDERLTLVIHPGSADQPTYWAFSECTTVEEARENVRARENSRLGDIHYVLRDDKAMEGVPPEIANRVKKWLARQPDIQGVVWTGLPSNWPNKRGRDFTPEDAVSFLQELEAVRDRAKAAYERAREYIVNAPPLIDTTVRRALRARGWEDARLSATLFEERPSQAKSESI